MFINNRLGLLESVETLINQEQRLNQVSNNLANVDTPGFKKETVTFDEMLYQANRSRQRVGKGLRINTVQEQGVVQKTDAPLDLAISGDGFFRVETPAGERYTRAGNFQRNNEGVLVTANGYPVLGDGGPITINGNKVNIARDGNVFVDGIKVDRLSVNTVDPLGLKKEGENLFRLVEGAAVETPESVQILQGHLEKSNVNTVTEMTEMIDLYRAYEGQQKMIRAVDDLDDLAVRRVGSLAG
ncbi:flagellar basal-body rod protein FlgF [Thiovibrio frasassiensis]|jgi:flagellar basal-body rod protein FlgG|uniref:Flagellar basal-body rod protein FlgF n=1 Tax=Thiovibrio frasassiensis TaxID=2984131 RepID=A0A9X4MHW3_9BACT|nr:flagellar basal-body rod protein FlgF [Thiovibrio frasassiensis]MDG4475843.1 flagellar basal-body rod protein FlgF [Thiovibrio frasassiensis]